MNTAALSERNAPAGAASLRLVSLQSLAVGSPCQQLRYRRGNFLFALLWPGGTAEQVVTHKALCCPRLCRFLCPEWKPRCFKPSFSAMDLQTPRPLPIPAISNPLITPPMQHWYTELSSFDKSEVSGGGRAVSVDDNDDVGGQTARMSAYFLLYSADEGTFSVFKAAQQRCPRRTQFSFSSFYKLLNKTKAVTHHHTDSAADTQ